MKRIITVLFICLYLFILGAPAFAATQSEIDNQNRQIETLKREIQDLDNQINDLETQTNDLNDKIAANTESLLQAQEEELAMRKESEARIRAIYMYGTDGYWNYLYSAESPSDFISYYDVATDIMQADRDSLNELKRKRQEIEQLQTTLTNDRNSLVETKKQAEATRAQKQSTLESNQSTLRALENQLNSENATFTINSTPMVTITEAVNDSVARVVSVPSAVADSANSLGTKNDEEISDSNSDNENEASAAMTAPRWMTNDNTQSSESSAVVSIPTDNGNTYVSAAQMPGAWVWPLDANGNGAFYITSLMGTREAPGGYGSTNHQGTDIGASYGTAILAATSGEVVLAGRNDGYGNAVKINHGNGYTTLYGHMSSIAVRSGEHVEAGQIIGFVGSTGWSTGPHLHFEVKYTDENGRTSLVNGLSLYGQEIYNRLSYSPTA